MDEIEAAGQKVFEMFAACGAAPDDVAVGEEADRALRHLDELLAGRPS
ncbi:hypothetical protein [Dactylosporangium sp. NPDC049140]